MATLADRVLRSLRVSGALDDDVLAMRLGVVRQQVNQVCRRLASQGLLRRVSGPTGKIVNVLTEQGTEPRSSEPPRTQAAPGPSASPPITEDEVKRAMRDLLVAEGYEVRVAWGRERGIDIEAKREGHRLVIEAKGAAPAGPQQVNYFLAALGELVQRMSDPNADYGLALPEHPQYRGLVERLPELARRRLDLRIWFVSRNADGLQAVEDAGGPRPG